ncbi:hypothetical protein C0992_002912 [Termitomyces sp. T32_za158]|nr:hypothetical protein C0992_002912 [Termitomyces sp. T32_za158]
MQFKNLFILASLAISSYTQTSVAQIEDDINNTIAPALDTFLNAIDAFPIDGGSNVQLAAILVGISDIITALAGTTTDVNDAACPVGDSDAQAILADLQALMPNIQQSLTALAARKTAFLAINGLVGVPHFIPFNQELQLDLLTLDQNADDLASAFITCAPVRPLLSLFGRKIDVEQADIVPSVQEFQSEIDDAFTTAIAALA